MHTRFCASVIVPNKEPTSIIKAIFRCWITIFGAPKQFLSDNGGEFSNGEMRSLGDRYNIKLLNTAAECPFSNGVCERLNGILADSVRRIIHESKCSVDIALAWAVAARNALHNFSGFAPNQLVFGNNPVYPSVFTGDAPQLEERTNSHIVAENLNAMNAARREFIRSESDDRVRRALLRQVRDDDPRKFETGDCVFYKRNASDEWRGPARVIGRDGKQIVVRHGGAVVRVHACRLQQDVPSLRDEGRIADRLGVDSSSRQQSSENEDDDHSDGGGSGDQNNFEHERESTPAVPDPVAPPSPKTLPKASRSKASVKLGQRINYFDKGQKILGTIVSRAGKVGGKHQHCFNIKQSSGDVSWVDLSTVNWQPVEDEAEVLVLSASDCVFDAKLKEIESWKENNVFTEVEDRGQKTISVRWIITEKIKEGKPVTKARLVVRGFEEGFNDRTDSPTCSKDSLRLCLSLVATKGWQCNTIDIKCAFLQGDAVSRDIFVRPPKEFDNGMLWNLRKSVYGLNDAARAWYTKLKEDLVGLSMKKSSLDPALFYHHTNGALTGLVCVHVDDIMYAGTPTFQTEVINPLMERITVGSRNSGSFKYIGVNIEQEGGMLKLHQNDYIETLKPVQVPKETSSRRSDQLGEREVEQFQALIGQLNWLSTQSRPEIGFSVCELSKLGKSKPIVDDLMRANKVVKRVQDDRYAISFPALNISSLSVECYSDASYGNLDDGGSQGGYLIFLTDGESRRALISWQSKRIRRVVKSTLAAESLALLDAAQAGVYITHMIKEILGVQPVIRCYVDNKSLVEALHSTKSVEDKHLRIDIAALKDLLETQEITSVSWVRSAKQLADVLTKKGASAETLVSAVSCSH